MTDLTHLDSTALKNFKNQDVGGFRTDLKNIREDAAGVKSLKNTITNNGDDSIEKKSILRIGMMGGGDNTDALGGGALLTSLTKKATGLDNIFVSQGTLFGDIDSALDDTITTLLKTQGDSLTSIDGEKLLDIFGTVDDDMSGTGDKTES
ncbi:type VII secretion system-associated protein [Streptomyces sp. B3I8]|uniref:type VII secretion system-associated protein n=1 Tax=Streptomyces sp. B3I8 TaxID=3042303 RepID=UPI002783A2FC|nr:type VII secretion system-associated protein [Streptomyces sp. B3I8]MDQ0790858.1 hypothetical protein [Streptomyces sp. B3I8]